MPKNPNVVIIYTDDVGCGTMSPYGLEHFQTENINRLAENGITFTNAYCNTPLCTPARYSLFTGEYSWRRLKNCGVIGNNALIIDTDRLSLPQVFKNANYRTAGFGKWHLGLSSDMWTDYTKPLTPGPNTLGFDYYFGIPVGHFFPPVVYFENDKVIADEPVIMHYNTKTHGQTQIGGFSACINLSVIATELTAKVCDYIKQSKGSEAPFFLYYATPNLHTPHAPGKQFAGKTNLGPYGDYIYEMDWIVGEVINTLQETGQFDNTIILLSSDSGSTTLDLPDLQYLKGIYEPNAPFRGCKGTEYEGGVRIPFIMSWPQKMPKGVRSDQIISQTDLLASFAGLLGQQIPDNSAVDSVDMHKAFFGETGMQKDREIPFQARQNIFAVRINEWKYIEGKNGAELYNLEKDIAEANNVAQKYPEIANSMKETLERIVKETWENHPGKTKCRNDGVLVGEKVDHI